MTVDFSTFVPDKSIFCNLLNIKTMKKWFSKDYDKVRIFFGYFPFILLSFSLLFSSCVRNTIEYEVPEGIAGLTVPADFNWSNVNTVELTVVPSDVYNGEYYYVIEVFDGNPVIDTAAVLLSKGVAKKKMNFVANIDVPGYSEILFVRQTDPLKLEIVQPVALGESNLTCDFNVSQVSSAPLNQKAAFSHRYPAEIAANETPSGAIRLTANLGSAITLSTNTAYVIPSGYTYTGKINFSSGSSLYVEGILNESATNAFQMADATKIVVQSGGVISAGTASQNFWAGEIINYGTVTLGQLDIRNSVTIYNYSGSLITNSKLITHNSTNKIFNYSTMAFGSVNLTNGSLDNMGYLTINGILDSNGATVTNGGIFIAGDISSTNSIYNADCNIEVLDKFTDLSGSTINIKEGSRFKSVSFDGSGTRVYFESSSILEASDVTFSSNQSIFQCTGSSYALARMVNVQPGNGSYKCIYYKGKLEIEVTSHYKGTNWNPFYQIENSVRWSVTGHSTTTITTGSCNGGGNTVIPPVTTPSDPVFPIEVPTSSVYTILMEDQWPSIGDYDMNDLVLGLSVNYSKDNHNMVTSMVLNTELRAVGAIYRIGAAFQLDELSPEAIKSVTYKYNNVLTEKIFPREHNGCESGQTKAVIPIFDDAHTTMDPTITPITTRMINTFNNQPGIQPKTNKITIKFSSSVNPAIVSIMKMNFFIVSNGTENSTKRTEVHLSGYAPTDKNDWTKLGMGYDNSINGVYYTTPGNMIWSLLIPVKFNYSAEMVNITEAYPQFSGWCTSGGVNYKNWYNNPIDQDGYLYVP